MRGDLESDERDEEGEHPAHGIELGCRRPEDDRNRGEHGDAQCTDELRDDGVGIVAADVALGHDSSRHPEREGMCEGQSDRGAPDYAECPDVAVGGLLATAVNAARRQTAT